MFVNAQVVQIPRLKGHGVEAGQESTPRRWWRGRSSRWLAPSNDITSSFNNKRLAHKHQVEDEIQVFLKYNSHIEPNLAKIHLVYIGTRVCLVVKTTRLSM